MFLKKKQRKKEKTRSARQTFDADDSATSAQHIVLFLLTCHLIMRQKEEQISPRCDFSHHGNGLFLFLSAFVVFAHPSSSKTVAVFLLFFFSLLW